jgi:hypothetical protein
MGAAGSSGELPARLERVRQRFERWRRTRQVGARIPEALWVSAVKAAGRYGVHRTARALSVDYYALKRRVEGRAPAAKRVTAKPAAKNRATRQRVPRSRSKRASAIATATGPMAAAGEAFLELPPPAWSGCGECSVELEAPRGAKMRVHLKGFPMPDLAALSRSFWK